MKFARKKGLGDSIKQAVHSGNEINRASKYFCRLERTYADDFYEANCKLKRLPTQMKAFESNVIGYLMRRPIGGIKPKLA